MGKKRKRRRSNNWVQRNAKYVGLAALACVAVGLVVALVVRPGPVTANPPRPSVPTEAATLAPERPVVVFIGDSYTAGAGASSAAATFTTLVGVAQGWQVENLGRGGTGYLATASTSGCGLEYCPNYREMITATVELSPDIIVVSGGRNDGDMTGSHDQVRAFYTELRAALPESKIVATSPLWDASEVPASLTALGGVVQESVTSIGGAYLDLKQPLQGRTDAVGDDGVHPNDAGYRAIADSFLAGWPSTGL